MTIACTDFEEIVDELALGVLTGSDRANALAHIDECHACRAQLAALSEVADEILLLAPPMTPDDDFGERVLAAIGSRDRAVRPPPRRTRGRHRVRALVALAATLAALGFAGIVASSHQGAAPAAEMRTTSGTVVGTVALRGTAPTLVEMRLPGWTALARNYGARPGTPYWLEIDRRDGSHQRVALDGEHEGSWNVVTTMADRDIGSVRVVDQHGVVWCGARFT